MYRQNDRIVASIFELLRARAVGASICPSEVARELQPDDWRTLMPAVRDVAAALAKEGKLEVRQRRRVIVLDGATVGPIRLALPT